MNGNKNEGRRDWGNTLKRLAKKIGVYVLCAILFSFITGLYYKAVVPEQALSSHIIGVSLPIAGAGDLLALATGIAILLILMPFGKFGAPILLFLVSSDEFYNMYNVYLTDSAALKKASLSGIGVAIICIICFIPYRMFKRRVDKLDHSSYYSQSDLIKSKEEFEKLHPGKRSDDNAQN